MSKVVTDNKHYTDIAGALRIKTGKKGTLKPSDMADEINEVYEAGKTKEWSDFWDVYLMKGTRETFYAAFYGAGWTDETFKPKYKMVPKNAQGMFNQSRITFIPEGMLELNTYTENVAYMFNQCPIKEINFRMVVTDCYNMNCTFKNATELETIKKIRSSSITTFPDTFVNAVSLKNIEFDFSSNGQYTFMGISNDIDFRWSPLLTKKSITSILNALDPLVSGKKLTLSLTAVKNAFGSTTSEEWLDITSPNSNWTINLV